jgi:sec-independent protein translocase protein TatA
MLGSLGLPELLVILLIVLVLFGANKLPQLGKGLGGAIRNFKEGINEGKDGPHQS